MANITLKGNPINTSGALPKTGASAPDFTLTAGDLSDTHLDKFAGKIKVLNIVPSLDTKTCSLSAKKFHEALKNKKDVVLVNISMDLPFAQERFCKAEGLIAQEFLSAFRSTFPKDYGVLITDGPIKGLCSRAVVVLDKDNKVTYTEQVPEISQEPNYDKVISALP